MMERRCRVDAPVSIPPGLLPVVDEGFAPLKAAGVRNMPFNPMIGGQAKVEAR
jgi:hypothetical protein